MENIYQCTHCHMLIDEDCLETAIRYVNYDGNGGESIEEREEINICPHCGSEVEETDLDKLNDFIEKMLGGVE